MKKMLLFLGFIGLMLITVVAIWFISAMGKPLYEPGMVRAEENLRAPLTPPVQNSDESYWSVEPDIQLRHFSAGKGQNVLIVHGGPGYPFNQPWEGLEPLTGEYIFHYYDQRGCGQSTRPIELFSSKNYYENMTALDRTLGLGAQVADIERIRRLLGEDKLILIGHSFGGFLASLYAAEFPEHIQAMVLIAPADVLVMPQKGGGFYEEVRNRLPENMREAYDATIKSYLDFQNIFSKSEAELVALNQEFAGYYQVATGASIPEQGEPGGWMVWAMYLSMGKRHDYREALGAVQAPVLVLHGADDLQTQEATSLYVQALPNASLYVFDDAAHFPFNEQPTEFATVVGSFLSEHREAK